MRLGVLSRSRTYWSTRRILQAIEEAGHEAVYLRTQDVRLLLKDGFQARCGDEDLQDLDAAIPRIGRSLTQLGYAILRHLEAMGVPSTLAPAGLLTARDKFLTLQALQTAGVPIPRSVLMASRTNPQEVLELLPFPAVLKILSGTQGVGVLRVKDPSEATSIVDTMHVLGEALAIQEFIPHPGVDIRALVVGEEVVGSMKRVAPLHEWRTNIHLGAQGRPHDLDGEGEDVALRAARATGLEIAGVDMVYRDEHPYILEVNACPGFRGLEEATGLNAAQPMVAYALGKAQG